MIQGALSRCHEVLQAHNSVAVSVSGGSDSDVMLDMLLRCGRKEQFTFVFFNTGLEYEATLEHLDELERKYGIQIIREKPVRSIPYCVITYGVQFYSKFGAEMMYRLQLHDFRWEDLPFDVLIQKYPRCKTALEWWCNVKQGNTTQYIIDRYPYLKEFIMSSPPPRVSNKCCEYAKKQVIKKFLKKGTYDLSCYGVRKSEGGIRAASHSSCFSEGNEHNELRPVFWLRDSDKEEYCRHYGVTHSRCYTEYGLVRTGCFGCPFGKRFEEELEIIKHYEPRLYRAALNIFGEAYDYTRRYLAFREKKKAERDAAKEDENASVECA